MGQTLSVTCEKCTTDSLCSDLNQIRNDRTAEQRENMLGEGAIVGTETEQIKTEPTARPQPKAAEQKESMWPTREAYERQAKRDHIKTWNIYTSLNLDDHGIYRK